MTHRTFRSIRHLERVPEIVRAGCRVRQWWRLLAAYLQACPPKYPLHFRTRTGIDLRLRDFHEVVTAWVVFCRREYTVPPDVGTVLDLGANFGAFTLLAASEAPAARILSLEPHPAVFARLAENVEAHGLAGRVWCWPAAVADATGSRRMSATGGPTQSRGLLARDAASAESTVEVQTLALDELIDRACRLFGSDRIGLVKIDVEGAEHEFLPRAKAADLARVEQIQMEYHPNGAKGPLFEALTRAEFRCARDRATGPDSGVACFRRDL